MKVILKEIGYAIISAGVFIFRIISRVFLRNNFNALDAFLCILALGLFLGLYSLVWIPAAGFIIFFAIKKDSVEKKRRHIVRASLLFISSLILYIWPILF